MYRDSQGIHEIEVPDTYIQEMEKCGILAGSAANLYLLENDIPYDAAWRPETDMVKKGSKQMNEKIAIIDCIKSALVDSVVTVNDWEDAPHGFEVTSKGTLRFKMNNGTYELSVVRKRTPKK